ncbi:hypothetical protein GEMRC1_011264 [Eukaryota sp. GEM-RC1]
MKDIDFVVAIVNRGALAQLQANLNMSDDSSVIEEFVRTNVSYIDFQVKSVQDKISVSSVFKTIEKQDRCKSVSVLVNFGPKLTLPKKENLGHSMTIWNVPADLLKTSLDFNTKHQSRPASTIMFGRCLLSDNGVEVPK